jgi:hypothetical protein
MFEGRVDVRAMLGGSMQNPPLFHALLDHLEAIDAPPMEIQRFVDRWHRLKPHERIPCPVCYLSGEEQPLTPLDARGNTEPVFCSACRTQYDIPIDET